MSTLPEQRWTSGPERRRIALTLLLSLLIHASLLSLIFSGEGHWFFWFAFPWQDRRIEAPELQVTIAPAPVTVAEPAPPPIVEAPQQAKVEQPPVARVATVTPPASRAPTSVRLAPAAGSEANQQTEAEPPTAAATPAATATPSSRTQSPNTTPTPNPAPTVIALERIDEDKWVVPATPAMQTPIIAAAPSAPIPEDEQRQAEQLETARKEAARLAAAQQEAQRREAARREAERQEVARREAERQEIARNEEAARVEAAQQEADRREAARSEAARREAERQEAARLAAVHQEAQRQEAARREEAARAEAARREAERQEAARSEAARRETERQEVARAEAREAEARREEKLRAIGRQLDEETAQRQAVSTSPSRALPPPWNLRRYKLLGRTDPNQEIILYAETFSRKIQLNMTFDMVREAVKQPHNNPVVTVAIRSDGSIESVTFFQSSGAPALDEAIRRVIDSQKPYQAFPPSLASQYDVLEIRRTWYFESAIRLY